MSIPEILSTPFLSSILVRSLVVGLLTALCACARAHCGADIEEEVSPVEITWDDSIITDTQAEKQQMLAEIAAGVVPKWMYLREFYGMGEDEARAAAPEDAVLDAGY